MDQIGEYLVPIGILIICALAAICFPLYIVFEGYGDGICRATVYGFIERKNEFIVVVSSGGGFMLCTLSMYFEGVLRPGDKVYVRLASNTEIQGRVLFQTEELSNKILEALTRAYPEKYEKWLQGKVQTELLKA